ncbi:MAG: VWA domain-containing protein [Planctomycetes bacterium]|nr:VWA domain-containing protein [Planctomycetota bacterium]
MTTSFLEPGFLWLLILAPLAFLPLAGRPPRRAWLRALVVALVVVGLARPVMIRSEARPVRVVVLDRSASATAAALEAAERQLEALLARPREGAELALVSLGRPPRPELAGEFDHRLDLGDRESSLATALALALRLVPEGSAGSICLISDAAATDHRFAPALIEARERGVTIDCLALDREPGALRPVDVVPLDDLRVGQVARLRVDLAGRPRPATLEVRLGADEPTRVELAAGVDQAELEIEPGRAGFQALDLRLVDERGEVLARLERAVAVQDALRLAYLGARMEGGRERLADLLGRGFELRQPGEEGALDLTDLDGILLDDRPATQLPADWQREIARAVDEEGLGLFLSGGRAAFGPGGYDGTPIEDLAPVEFMQKEEKKDPSTTLAIIIDTSGSMIGNRMTIAKEVARLAIRRLEPHDKVGIVEFYGTKQWAAPIQSAANAIDLQRAINRLGAEGGTVLYPAVEEAYYALKNVETRFKHVLILTDAGVETGPYETLLRHMADDGVTVSTVLVGPGRHSEFLVELADWGGGRYYGAPDRFNLPELMLKKPNTSALPAYRPGRVEVEARGGRGWWGGDRPESLPPLDGYVETRLKPGAELLLRTRAGTKPLLASWQRGLGRVSALMTEPTGAGTAGWADWTDYGRLLGRLIGRTTAFRRPPFAVELKRRDWRLVVDLRRLDETADRPLLRRLNADAGEELQPREIAPGLYRAVLAVDHDEVARLELTASGHPGWRWRVASDPSAANMPETDTVPWRSFDLAAAATATGGSLMVSDDLPALWPRIDAARGHAATALWPFILLLALLAFATEVLLRRLPRDRARNER